MENITKNKKKTLRQKLLGFQKAGLKSYRQYLLKQREHASKSKSRKAYGKYIEKEIVMTSKKIKAIKVKLK
jgi:hypothetical protein